MTRILALLSSTALLAAAAHAQCATPAATTPATLVNWDYFDSYASTFGAADEGITSPPIDLTPAFGAGGFPMAGAVGTLDQMWINSNGHVYLTDSTLALAEPVGPAAYGLDSLAEARGGVGGSARIFAFGPDQQDSTVLGAVWGVTCDVTPGSVKVTWTDMARYFNTTDRFSYSMTLLSGGVVSFDYSATFPATTAYVGISIGNDVGTTSSPSRNLKGGPFGPSDSGSEGLLYSSMTFNLADSSVVISPNGIGGYVATQTCGVGNPANNTNYGVGCHNIPAVVKSSYAQTWPTGAAAKAVLDGNALQFTLAGSGYSAQWIPGGGVLYVPPTGGATVIANADDTTTTFSPSLAAPIPGGTAPSWTVSSNGILTAAATGNNGTSWTPSLASMATDAGLAWFVWHDFYPPQVGSGQIKREEVGGILYVTWDGVEAYPTATVNPATFQFQVDLTTGTVTMVFVSYDADTSAYTTLVGCTLAGTGTIPVSSNIAVAPAFLLTPTGDVPAKAAMTLSAAPAPVINPSTVVTYTAGNLPEFIPTSGVYLSTMFLSVDPNPFGFDLNGILTTVPGCNAWIVTLDLDLGAQLTAAPTATWNFTYDNVNFAPGNAIAAQAVALFDSAFPLGNGESGGFLFSNAVLSTTQTF